MAWSWSHTQEAYDTAHENLASQDRKWLIECLAEIEANDAALEEWEHVFADAVNKAQELNDIELVHRIWEFAKEYRTCDNGGFNAHMCPDGCHSVSFG